MLNLGMEKISYQAVIKEEVNHPDHYQGNGIEVIDIIDSFGLNFNLGNSIKYILRADKKGFKKKDLSKAVWYLNRELEKWKG
jgi:hypothetical protein